MKTPRKLTPLLAITITTILIGATAYATWLWTSPVFTYTFTVEDTIDAKTIDGASLTPDTPYEDIPIITTLLGSGPQYAIYVILDWQHTNTPNITAAVNITSPGNSNATVHAKLVTKNTGSAVPTGGDLGITPTDGTPFSVALLDNGHWLAESNPQDEYHILQLTLTFTPDYTLPPGEYGYGIVVSLGG